MRINPRTMSVVHVRRVLALPLADKWGEIFQDSSQDREAVEGNDLPFWYLVMRLNDEQVSLWLGLCLASIMYKVLFTSQVLYVSSPIAQSLVTDHFKSQNFSESAELISSVSTFTLSLPSLSFPSKTSSTHICVQLSGE